MENDQLPRKQKWRLRSVLPISTNTNTSGARWGPALLTLAGQVWIGCIHS